MGLTARLLAEVWGQRSGYIFLPRKENGQWVESYGHTYEGKLPAGMKIRSNVDQYFSPLVFSARQRRTEHALPTHVLWSDLDGVDPAKCRLRPSAAWRTTQGGSHGDHPLDRYTYEGCPGCHGPQSHWQALWFLKREDAAVTAGLISRKDIAAIDAQWGVNRQQIPAVEAAELSRRIAYAEGADKGGWDVTQVLRLPGTYNHKHSPPQRVEMLWAERRYYTVEQVRSAYPSVPIPETAAGAGWLAMPTADVDAAISRLPIGLQIALDRDSAGADRSLELVRLARTLLRFAPAEVVPHILARARINKYKGRADEQQRLLTAVADALLSRQ